MGLVQTLAPLALRQLIAGACDAVGFKAGSAAANAVADFLAERFTDHSQRLTTALADANDKAWKALEIALAGESLWERCQAVVARAEDRAFGRQVRAFLDATPLAGLPGHGQEFRQECLRELRAARKANLLGGGGLDPRQLARQVGAFARFAEPSRLLDAEWGVVGQVAEELRRAGCANLGRLVAMRPPEGLPLLVIAARYFFRRAVEDDPKLSQGLAFAQMEKLGEAQEQGFAALAAALAQRGARLEELLGDVRAVVVETHGAVLDLQAQMRGQGEQIRQTGQAVLKVLERYQLQRRELRPGDSLSIRSAGERELVKQIVARYRALPDQDRRQVPALLNAIGKLEVVAGDFHAAQRDFERVATLTKDAGGQAEAHFNAYRAALERRDWDAALQAFFQAVRLDARRFAPFPVGKYHPLRILGAGGFGVAFLCKHKYMEAPVVVKTLTSEDLGRDADKVFAEAQVLRELDHPAVIRVSDCGYADSGGRSRPFLVMDYFEGVTLEEHVKEHGPLPVADVLAVARQVAEGLQAAHGKSILHRDVKPANLLVRKEGEGWRVKVIDFGLALREGLVGGSGDTKINRQKKTLIAGSIAGTLDYAAPEQMGRRAGVTASPASDVYGFAKTCCYALFQTTQPLLSHWQSLPLPLAQLLERCLSEDPQKRPQHFTEVLAALDAVKGAPVNTAVSVKHWAELSDASSIIQRHPAEGVKKPREWLGVWLLGFVVLLLAGVVGLWAGGVFRLKTPEGILVVEVNEPNPDVYVDGDKITVTWGEDGKTAEIRLRPGTRKVEVKKDGCTVFGEEVTVQDGERRVLTARLVRKAPPARPGEGVTPPTPPITQPGETTKETPSNTRPEPLDCTGADGLTAVTVRRAQEAWAKYLGREVEETVEVADGVKMTFVLVPPGKFLMGSPGSERDRSDDETLHEVTLTEPFDLGQTEVTQAQYQALTGKNPSWFSGSGGGKEKVKGMDTSQFPVEEVNWAEARACATRLMQKRIDQHVYGLPTEAEWEYACRAGRSYTKPFSVGDGSALSSREANFNGNFPYGGADKGPDLESTCRVGSYPPNALGLADMHGNVWEWCIDWYGPYPKGAVTNPVGPSGGSDRVSRGSCWNAPAWSCRTASRNKNAPEYRCDNVGFRLARSVPSGGK